ncbi:bifunctional riboflavin kinase/FAD synthetase [Gammaproteobacteria bacterium]|nr:bifunctional riboflavin kinase/FAD synthetase [Gammaproteobacteria bacterium]
MTTLHRISARHCPRREPALLAIGNFDGLHRGHQAIIAAMREQARIQALPTRLMLFEPHPLEFFAGDAAPKRITSLREKYRQIRALGVDEIVMVRFDADFAALQPKQFVEQLLLERLQTRGLWVGQDFRFGRDRQGDVALLGQYASRGEFSFGPIDDICLANGKRISSTAVREALANNDLERAKDLLGRQFSIVGRVSQGRQLGRQLGFPTANLPLNPSRVPLSGVYAVRVFGDHFAADGVANIGTRPTVDGSSRVLEVHLLDFDSDLYGQRIEVRFCRPIREERHFASLELLKAQVFNDIQQARQWMTMENES